MQGLIDGSKRSGSDDLIIVAMLRNQTQQAPWTLSSTHEMIYAFYNQVHAEC